MQFETYSKFSAVILLWHFLVKDVTTSTLTRALKNQATPDAQSVANANGTCEFRVINYITDNLPKQCLKNSWSASNGAGINVVPGNIGSEDDLGMNITETVLNISSNVTEEVIQESSSNTAVEAAYTQETALDLSENQSTFLSFEEWKKQTLEKAEHKDFITGQKKNTDTKKRESDSSQNNVDPLGDEKDMNLKITSSSIGSKETNTRESQAHENQVKGFQIDKKRGSYMSKDAGKTCKERFSYSSFDAGATVLKTHPGAKNAKNVLIENKDSYMLSECSVENKFIIIELSEDIWIDTVVLANYEFFSSMIRTFRVSVSDRYPVKMEKWKEVGTYEARNSREIQAFLVENPQIWARYIRIEFLNHYGTEYYCPLSLVRVHGTRMLESWKETEAAGEDEDIEEGENSEEVERSMEDTISQAAVEGEKIEDANIEAFNISNAKNSPQDNSVRTTEDTTSWKDPSFFMFNADPKLPLENVCFLDEVNSQQVTVSIIETITMNTTIESISFGKSKSKSKKLSNESILSTSFGPEIEKNFEVSSNQATSSSIFHEEAPDNSSSNTSQLSNTSQGRSSSISSPNNHNTSATPTVSKNKTSSHTTSSAPPLPTIQESFFKAVSRRLTLLESNSTLTLAYISEATSHLHHAFASLARNITRTQLSKTTVFLEAINSTVFSELRGFRKQYDEIWQSTVISLESQKDESRREILSVTERLNILAQEVVWQRRMSMAQSVILLLCLGIVIFSRVSAASDQLFIRPRSRASNHSRQFNVDSPSEPGSPIHWPDTNGTPLRTPNRSHNYLSNPNLNHIYDNHKITHQVYSNHSMYHTSIRSPATSYFDQASHSPYAYSDREFTPLEDISLYHSNSHTQATSLESFPMKLRRAKSSPQVYTSSGLSRRYESDNVRI